ncbi:MAG: T9SS type A sorting domain-containing protein [Bacteroidota bacterium]
MKIGYSLLISGMWLLGAFPLFGQESTNCFMTDFESKYIIDSPPFQQEAKTTTTPTVTVTFYANDTLVEVSKYLYGNNANTYMTQMVDQPSLIDYISLLSPNILRFPGGNLSSVYFWDALPGLPPADAPDSLVDGSTGENSPASYWYGKNTFSWTISVDNYYNMLGMTGSTGIITINYAYARYGTSQDPVATAAHSAANWVRYDDGRTRFWEIGNENYGEWEAGYRIDPSKNKDGQPAVITGELYGTHFKVFADSMHKAAQELGYTIYIGAVLYEQAYGTSTQSAWDAGFFKQAGNAADFFIVHSYYTNYMENSSAATILNSAATVTTNIMNYVKQVINAKKVSMKPIALTEWNIFAVGSKQMCSFINGMHSAIVLGELAKNGYSMSSRWDLANGYENGNDHGMFNIGDEPGGVPKWNPRPPFFYMYFFQRYFGDHILRSYVTGNSNVLAYASIFGSGHAGIVVVNKGTAEQVVKLEPLYYGFGERYYVYSLTGGSGNGDFSQAVYVNETGPTNTTGGPIKDLEEIPAWGYSIGDEIRFISPPRSVQYILIEPGDQMLAVKSDRNPGVVDQFKLYQNYPNPFNPQTTISYSLPRASSVTLRIYDPTGREIATLIDNERKAAGTYEISFNAKHLPSGVYFYRLRTENFTETKSMVLIK